MPLKPNKNTLKKQKYVDNPLSSKSEKEDEIEKLLKEEEEMEATERLQKKGMSDQIANTEDLKEIGKDIIKGAKKGVKKVYRKVKSKVKSMME